jgi:integrative and conjugative element protein (TIGR02256 family)
MRRGVIQITKEALTAIRSESRASSDGRETGGILLGHDSGEPGPVIITIAGDPGPRAHRSRSNFKRDLEHASGLADAAYAKDGSVWLGEWHTHPRGPASPSDRDVRTYRRFLLDVELDFPRVASLIVNPRDDTWRTVEVRGWIVGLATAGSTRRPTVTPCDVVPLPSTCVEATDDCV